MPTDPFSCLDHEEAFPSLRFHSERKTDSIFAVGKQTASSIFVSRGA
jgi:hypothetical protein